jgi:hypothetical protein
MFIVDRLQLLFVFFSSRHKTADDLNVNLLMNRDDNPIFPTLLSTSDHYHEPRNDQNKLELLVDQLGKRLLDEESYRQRLLDRLRQASIKSDQSKHVSQSMMSNTAATTDYRRRLYLSDHQAHQSVADELNVAVRETQHRIDWLTNVHARARQCLER